MNEPRTLYVCHGMYTCDTGCCGYRLCLDDESYDRLTGTRFTFSHPSTGQTVEDFARAEWPKAVGAGDVILPGLWFNC